VVIKSKSKRMESNQDNNCLRLLADPIQIQACKRKLKMAGRSFENLAQVLSLAGNEVRLKILYLLEQEGELCPCDLSDILGMTIPAVSQHLRKLKDANLVQFRKEGQTIFYALKSNHADIIKPLFIHVQQKELAI
jgi:DNA-binding transcriptional ArsR family regulator